MDCPKCKNEKRIKNGVISKRQRYKCKTCGYNYTVEKRSYDYPMSTKKKALQLYLEGLGFRSIGRVLGVSDVSVLNWVKSFGTQIAQLESETRKVNIVEVDEMQRYIKNKKATVGCRLLLIDLEKGASTSLLAIGK